MGYYENGVNQSDMLKFRYSHLEFEKQLLVLFQEIVPLSSETILRISFSASEN